MKCLQAERGLVVYSGLGLIHQYFNVGNIFFLLATFGTSTVRCGRIIASNPAKDFPERFLSLLRPPFFPVFLPCLRPE